MAHRTTEDRGLGDASRPTRFSMRTAQARIGEQRFHLVILGDQPYGPATVTELGRELGTGHSTVSGIVDRLQVRGLVQRVRDDTDWRYTRICVTEKVDRYVVDMEAGPFGRLTIALGNATEEERRTIRDGLGLLRELLT